MIDRLNQQHALPGTLSFSPGQGGMPRAQIKTDNCQGEAYLFGAHITRWRPAGHDQVLWLSDHARFNGEKAIRGGVPLCFPWFADNRPADQPDAPAHGYARIRPWQIQATASTNDRVAITFNNAIQDYDLTYTATFGKALHLALQVTNTADTQRTYEAALHTYFTVSQIRNVTVTGLESAGYLDTAGGANAPHPPTGQPIRFDGETDRVYDSAGEIMLHDPGLGRRVRIVKGNSGSTVVWNPWDRKAAAMGDFGDDEWPGMVCIESANTGPNAVTLAPGDSHTMTTSLQIEKTD